MLNSQLIYLRTIKMLHFTTQHKVWTHGWEENDFVESLKEKQV